MNILTIDKPKPVMKRIEQDQKRLALFIEIYCQDNHVKSKKSAVDLKKFDVEKIVGRPLCLCARCQRLLTHAFVKRSVCTMNPKPTCKNCPKHCYAPAYRQQIRQVMRYAGRKLVLRGRLDYLYHMLF